MYLLQSVFLVASFLASGTLAGPWGWGSSSSSEEAEKCTAKWGDWETTSKCVWPGAFTKADAPKACMAMPPKPEKMPDLAYKILEAKHDDYFNRWQVQLKDRGMGDKPCGMCGFKLKCRQIAEAPTSMNCPVKEKIFVKDAACQSDAACKLSMKDGGCDGPEVLDMMFFISVMKAMQKGHFTEDMMYGHKIEQFMGMMMGAPNMMGMMKGKGMGKMFGGKGKRRGSKSSKSSQSSQSSSSEENDNSVQQQLDSLVNTFSGKNKDEVLGALKTMMSQDNPAAAKIRETLEAFKTLFASRKKRQAGPMPVGAATKLADNESYLSPKVMCIPNKENDACLCCCDWSVPDRDTGKCVNMKEPMIAFIKDFAKDDMMMGW